MKTLAQRRFTDGFALTEQELRRIHDILDQQIRRVVAPDEEVSTSYELTFRNGVVSTPSSLIVAR